MVAMQLAKFSFKAAQKSVAAYCSLRIFNIAGSHLGADHAEEEKIVKINSKAFNFFMQESTTFIHTPFDTPYFILIRENRTIDIDPELMRELTPLIVLKVR